MIVAGFGFRGAAALDSLAQALDAALAADLPAPDALAAAADRAGAPALVALAAWLGLPVIAAAPQAVAAARTATQSPAALAARRTGSLAEAAALAGAGPGARLLAPRFISPDRKAACALAIGELS